MPRLKRVADGKIAGKKISAAKRCAGYIDTYVHRVKRDELQEESEGGIERRQDDSVSA
jgi:hypothetical protein